MQSSQQDNNLYLVSFNERVRHINQLRTQQQALKKTEQRAKGHKATGSISKPAANPALVKYDYVQNGKNRRIQSNYSENFVFDPLSAISLDDVMSAEDLALSATVIKSQVISKGESSKKITSQTKILPELPTIQSANKSLAVTKDVSATSIKKINNLPLILPNRDVGKRSLEASNYQILRHQRSLKSNINSNLTNAETLSIKNDAAVPVNQIFRTMPGNNSILRQQLSEDRLRFNIKNFTGQEQTFKNSPIEEKIKANVQQQNNQKKIYQQLKNQSWQRPLFEDVNAESNKEAISKLLAQKHNIQLTSYFTTPKAQDPFAAIIALTSTAKNTTQQSSEQFQNKQKQQILQNNPQMKLDQKK